MRKLAMALAIASVAGAANGAQAADLGGRYYEGSMKDEPYAAPTAIWSGLYVGGHLGGLWNDAGDSSAWKRHCYEGCSDWKELDYVSFSKEDDLTLLGGVHIGYNWQSGARVFGVEGDVSFADGVDYLASLRARLGYAMDSLLIYATAGVAFVGLEDKKLDVFYGDYHAGTWKVKGDDKIGAVVGAGVEYKLASNWSVGVEGLYYFFGDSQQNDIWGEYCQTKFTHDDDNDMFVVRGRISYHFSDDRYDAPLK
jgi:outer membrane immunogenic protein